MSSTEQTRRIVREYLERCRSGKEPEAAVQYLAPSFATHYVFAEQTIDGERTPEWMIEHINEQVQTYGDFEFVIDELLADGDRAFVRTTQRGTHVGVVNGIAPTGRPLTVVTHAVYRVEGDRIVEYWLNSDRAGLAAQLA